jgi:GntR family transcriptional regulator, transcriptional repressor for pyruvate dehydrogenase complex
MVLRPTIAGGLVAEPPVRGKSLADQVYERILEQIVSGQLAEGIRLPPEVELARAFDVSRSTLRQALGRLQADGLIVSRRGSGSYVGRRPPPDILNLQAIGGAPELFRSFELRITLEGDAAGLAAIRHQEADLAEMAAALQEQERSMDRSGAPLRELIVTVNKADLRFHRAVAAACGNELFTGAIDMLNEAVLASWILWEQLSKPSYERLWDIVLDEHRQVFEAIAERNAERARRAMRHHLHHGRARILGDFPQWRTPDDGAMPPVVDLRVAGANPRGDEVKTPSPTPSTRSEEPA